MANHTGSEGAVKIGSNAIAEVRSWSLDETGDTIEDTSMGDAARTYKAGLTSWSGSVTCYWDETDTSGQGAMDTGSSVTLNLYPEGATAASIYYTGTVLLTGTSRTASFDGMVEATYNFQGTGSLTEGTAS
jgi:hypothetical protein